MSEVSVTLTDYALSLECLAFVALLSRCRTSQVGMKKILLGLFVCLSLASLLGGTVHGFYPKETSLLWGMTLVLMGLSALFCWILGSYIALSDRGRGVISVAASLIFSVYLYMLSAGHLHFSIAVINYLPAIVFLLGCLIARYLRTRDRNCIAGIWGLGLSLIAAAIQQWGLDIDPLYLNHNALYHIVEAVALGLMFLTFRALLRT